jgi:hypothetical protein
MNKVVYLDAKRRRVLPMANSGAGPAGSTAGPEAAVAPQAIQVSIVMVSYHTGPALEEAIDAVLAQGGDLELIVVDNGNPEEVTAALKARSLADPRVNVLTGHGNVGYAAACNLGAQRASGEYLLLLNPDCVLQPDALIDMIRLTEGAARPWVAGCRIVNPDGTDQRGSRRELDPVADPGRSPAAGPYGAQSPLFPAAQSARRATTRVGRHGTGRERRLHADTARQLPHDRRHG